MGDKKSAADTESGKYTRKQAEDDGWSIFLEEEPKAITARGTGATVDVQIREGRFVAEKTVDDHLITAAGSDEEELLEAIRSQQASIDNRPRGPLAMPLLNDNAGDTEDGDNVGIAGVLPETEVDREAAAEAQGVQLVVNP